MAFHSNISERVPDSPSIAPTKYQNPRRPTGCRFRTAFSPRHNRALAAVVFCVILLSASGRFSKAMAIDVYHFLVEYKNGRVVERIFPESPESYQITFKGYVTRTKLIEKRDYSVDGFIQTFGEASHELLMAGYFGFGVEEQTMFNRQTQGLKPDAGALPPPDKTSAKLLDAWKYLENKAVTAAHEEESSEPTPDDSSKTKAPSILKTNPARIDHGKKSQEDETPSPPLEKETANKRLQEEKAPLSQPTPSETAKISETEKIEVYRFLVRYINGRTMKKITTMTPEQYQNRYPGYVKKTALIEKKRYTESQFGNAFGEKAHNLLVQGNFGVGDVEMIMQSRMERGMPPRENVLPKPGPESEKLSKRLEQLLRNKNFTLRGP
ncbi:MAG: hypothetical protein K9N10_07110 [Deltaproteobacteria bacterium]|nr:hypothetical protein [Deltaproteobacteria bacterium]